MNEALLERLETDADGGERWVGYAAGPRDVGHAIDEVVAPGRNLNHDDAGWTPDALDATQRRRVR